MRVPARTRWENQRSKCLSSENVSSSFKKLALLYSALPFAVSRAREINPCHKSLSSEHRGGSNVTPWWNMPNSHSEGLTRTQQDRNRHSLWQKPITSLQQKAPASLSCTCQLMAPGPSYKRLAAGGLESRPPQLPLSSACQESLAHSTFTFAGIKMDRHDTHPIARMHAHLMRKGSFHRRGECLKLTATT